MNENQRNKCFETGRLPLTTMETVLHYFSSLFMLIMPVILLYMEFSRIGTIDRIPYIELFMFLVAGIFFYHSYHSLAFKKYRIAHSVENFKAVAKATAQTLDWRVIKLTNHVLIAEKHNINAAGVSFSITIIREEDKLYENIIVDSFSMDSGLFLGGLKQKNLHVFNNNLIYAARGEMLIEKIKENQFENDADEAFIKVAKKILIYLVFFFLLLACAVYWSTGYNFIIIPIGSLCIAYIFLDLIKLFKKSTKKNF